MFRVPVFSVVSGLLFFGCFFLVIDLDGGRICFILFFHLILFLEVLDAAGEPPDLGVGRGVEHRDVGFYVEES